MTKYWDYFFINRPILFFPGWTTMFIGKWLGEQQQTGFSPPIFKDILPDISDLILLLGFAALMGGCFILNQIRDRDSDRLNEKLFFIHKDLIPLRFAWIEAIALIVLGMAVLSLVKNTDLLIVATIFVLVTGYLYNFSPIRAKDRVWSGLMANMLMGEAAFALGFFAECACSWDIMIISSLGVLVFNTGLFVLTTLPDMEGDRASKKKTIGSLLGIKNGAFVGAAVTLAGLLLMPKNHPWVWVTLLFSLPFMLHVIFRPNLENTVRALKFSIFGFSLGIALYKIWFALLGVIIFWGTKFYFRKRFGLDYPNFSNR